MRRIKQLIITSMVMFAFALNIAPAALAAGVLDSACSTAGSSVICQQTKNADDKTDKFITNLINTLMFAVGTLAVIMIIIGGIRYVTSNGDSGAITGAKNTILYSVIGLMLALMSWGIASFVVDQF